MAKATSTIEKQPDGVIKLTITIPWEKVQKAQEEVINQAVLQADIAGFRKGRAPRKIVEENMDQQKLKEEALKKVLPESYVEAVQQHTIRPIINPKIHVDKMEDKKDWTFTALTCEMPEVKLNDYKESVRKITAKSKIIVPGKEKQEPSFDEIMKAVLEKVDVKIPPILTEQEVDRLLSQMLDEVKRLGLTLDQYLASTNRKPEDLRAEYAQKAEGDIKLELTLQKIAEEENLTVDEKEIEEAIEKAKDPQERQHLQANRYLLAGILRQQKTLDFLKNL